MKPAVVERWTLYAGDADVVGRASQLRSTVPGGALAAARPAAVGAVVSAVTAALASFEAGPDVAGGVLGGDAVVVGAGREAGVGVAGARRLGDPVRRATA